MAWLHPDPVDSPPYEQLSVVYDYVMRHVDYVEWADYVETLFGWCGEKPAGLIEVACGTGTLAGILCDRGYAVSAYDISEGMIARARMKTTASEANAPVFVVADMRNLPRGDADACLCLYDSLNYCLTYDDLRGAFRSFRGAVRGSGIAIFDVTTEANSLRYFRDYRYRERHGGYTYNRHSVYNPATRMQTNEFVFRGNGLGRPVRELHRQRIFSLKELLQCIPSGTWSVLGAFDGYTLDPPDDDSERIHIVMRALPERK